MENLNEEKSLVKVDNSIFAKMRRFFHGLFSKRKSADNIEIENYNNQKEVSVEKAETKREVYTEPKLFNYDNPQYQYDSTLGKKPILNNKNNNEENILAQFTSTDSGVSKYFCDDTTKYSQETEENETDEEYKANEEDGYEGKEELEKKLMNYYSSIKKVIQ